ncbi:hypothetical protein C2S53_018120 [Perilla frutescens var. hirtella]|uniref:Protein kinase domain-containing protein n=1 Tax=Perilla frutescens var. hirtella TaxID=608512 RepID=A0AAD4IRH4_PERFH|nr:hypothetical protein C2S53_018120 [Perilla frutescens var. hirtella]
MGFSKFLKFLRLKLRRRRVAERVAAVDFNGEEDDHNMDWCEQQRSKGGARLTLRMFSWEEIQKLTMNFSIVIGYGGFSTVYLAKLSDSSMAAAKIQFRCSQRLNEAYEKELEILLRINHPYIVKLIGYCDEDREEGTLILEHVANGNLHERLHGSNSSSILSWRGRMAIAFQLADAIDYLHKNSIVHCDIKASNILLDEHLNCKLCDFGSSKMGFSSLVVPSSSRAMMLGSPGYTDPHYLRTGLTSKKSDVYSFGVILLELICGMEALDPLSGSRLTKKAEHVLRGAEKVVEIADPRLRSGGDFDMEEAKAMADVAAMCLSDSPAHRPSLSEVLTTMRKKVSSISYLF